MRSPIQSRSTGTNPAITERRRCDTGDALSESSRATLTDLAGTVLNLEQAGAVLRAQAGITVLPVGVPINHSPTEGQLR